MGFSNPFKKRRKTTVETVNETAVETKIVKLSYLETIAVDGGTGNISELAGETEASESNLDPNVEEDKNKIEKFAGLLNSIGPGGNSILGNALSSLFGKKVTRETKVNVKDSGWSIIKVWNQPQFDILRYAIGIKELSVSQFTYVPVSEIVSKPWVSPKEIVKVTLLVDQFIPNEFQPGNSYIEYYIKPDDEEADWVRINPLGLPTVFNKDNSIVPRIISFNTEQPVNSRLEESYVTTSNPVKSVRFKAIINRPDSIVGSPEVSANAYTPVLKSYKLLLTPRNGL